MHGRVHEDREDSIGVFGLAWLWLYVANAMDGDGYGEHEWMDDIDGRWTPASRSGEMCLVQKIWMGQASVSALRSVKENAV